MLFLFCGQGDEILVEWSYPANLRGDLKSYQVLLVGMQLLKGDVRTLSWDLCPFVNFSRRTQVCIEALQ